MLECQVSAQDFVAAIGILSDTKLMTVISVPMHMYYISLPITIAGEEV